MERFLFKKIELWLVFLLVIILGIGALLFGWGVQYKAMGGLAGEPIGSFLLEIAKAPTPIIKLLNNFSRTTQPQLFPFSEFTFLKRSDPSFKDDGILLVSGRSKKYGHGTAYLYDLESEKKLFEWVPPVSDILAATSYRGDLNDTEDFRSQHPYLLEDGSLLVTSGEGPLVRFDACGKLTWAIDHHFHHSIERGPNGNFYVPSVLSEPKAYLNDHYPSLNSITVDGHKIGPLRDDGFAIVSPEGKILNEWSIKTILEENGYWGLLYGVGAFEIDRIHLNDAEPIMESDAFVQKGDVVLSARNLSTVFLFRPSTGKIVWLKTGPWINQHDVDYQGEGIFTIFGNDFVRNGAFLNGTGAIYQYDQSRDESSVRLNFDVYGIAAETGGLHTVLDNGDIFIEQPYIRLHRLNGQAKRWTFVNTVDEGEVGALFWSRYFERDALNLSWMKTLNCDNN